MVNEAIVIEESTPFVKDKHFFPPEYEGHFDLLMLSSAQIQERVRTLAVELAEEYKGQRPVLVCTLKGACPFFTHLCDALQHLRQGYFVEFVRASSYEGTSTTGQIDVVGELKVDHIRGRPVVLIEDILDTGTTLSQLVPLLTEKGGPTSVKVCTLLDKRLDPSRKKYKADYVGFSIPDQFIIGYGLDFNELYRDLKDIFVISQAGIEYGSTTNHGM